MNKILSVLILIFALTITLTFPTTAKADGLSCQFQEAQWQFWRGIWQKLEAGSAPWEYADSRRLYWQVQLTDCLDKAKKSIGS